MSNYRASQTLDEYLKAQGVMGIADVDTRAITRRLRQDGCLNGVITTDASLSDEELIARTRVRRSSTLASPSGPINFSPRTLAWLVTVMLIVCAYDARCMQRCALVWVCAFVCHQNATMCSGHESTGHDHFCNGVFCHPSFLELLAHDWGEHAVLSSSRDFAIAQCADL